eukprot:354083-Chlamydomonas_euryale.AAC.7
MPCTSTSQAETDVTALSAVLRVLISPCACMLVCDSALHGVASAHDHTLDWCAFGALAWHEIRIRL